MIQMTAVVGGRRTLFIGLLPTDPPVMLTEVPDGVDELAIIVGETHSWIRVRVERLASL